MTASIDDYRWLVSDATRVWLAAATQMLNEGPDPGSEVRAVARLRKELSAERAHLVLQLASLRRRAREKFSRAEEMFFTARGLEQATDERVAAFKAERFAPGARIGDFCCGIGGDLLALAAAGPVTGIDRDPVTALFARANAAAYGNDDFHAAIVCGEVGRASVNGFDAWHIDPDRRASGRRTTRIEAYEPPQSEIEGMLARNGNAAIKLAPAAETPAAWKEQAELQWTGSRGECRQQVAWFGSLARHSGLRSATVVDAPSGPHTFVGQPGVAVPVANSLGPLLYEPHSAILAANLTGAICAAHNLAPIAAGVAYLTSSQSTAILDPALAAFEVRDVLPLDRKQLKAYCSQHRLGRLEIKKRGVNVDPERLRKEVASQGDEFATLLVAPLGGKVRVVVGRRVTAGVIQADAAP